MLCSAATQASRARMDQLMAWGACGVLAVAGRRDVYLWRRPVESNLPGASGGRGASELLASYGSASRPMSLCWSPCPARELLVISVGHTGRVQVSVFAACHGLWWWFARTLV